jgi:Autoinducer binding domain
MTIRPSAFSAQHGLATSYPEDWMKHYAKHNFSSIDPVTRQVLTKRTPFFWSDVTSRLDRLSDPHRMMDQAADAGLGDGIGISLRGDGPELVVGRDSEIVTARIGTEQTAGLQFLGRRISAQHLLA